MFPSGLDFKAVDSERVYGVFLLLSPSDQADEHVQVLRWLAGMIRAPDFISFIRQTSAPEDTRSLLEEMGG